MLFGFESTRQRRKAIQFATCIGLAIIAWLGLIFSKSYTYEVESRIEVRTGESVYSPSSIRHLLVLRSSGWKYALLKVFHRDRIVLNDPARKGFVRTADHFTEIEKQLKGIRVIAVQPDTIFLPSTVLSKRKVPVVIDAQLKFNPQFWLAGPLIVYPDSVFISGEAKDIDSIRSVSSKPLRVNGLNANVMKTIGLQEVKGLAVIPDTVRVTIPVVSYTENFVWVPLAIRNDLDNYDVQTVPKRVKVAYKVSLNRYSSIHSNAFKASVDLNEWMDKKQNRLTVHLDEASANVQVLGVYPSKVDFMVRKQ